MQYSNITQIAYLTEGVFREILKKLKGKHLKNLKENT
jgi:hypothetical protein